MLKGILEFSYLLGADPFLVILVLVLLFLLLVVKCLFPWQPKWRAKKTKDKDGNEIITYYHLDE